PLPFSIFGSFYPNVRIFFYVKILVGDIEGGAKKKPTILVFFCWAQFFAPPSEWRPRRPPIPPVGKTAPAPPRPQNQAPHHGRPGLLLGSATLMEQPPCPPKGNAAAGLLEIWARRIYM